MDAYRGLDWRRPHYYSFSDAPYYPAEFGGDGRLITMAESGDGIS